MAQLLQTPGCFSGKINFMKVSTRLTLAGIHIRG